MHEKDCKAFKEAGIWKEELCKWCVSSCDRREHDYSFHGNRRSLKKGYVRATRVGVGTSKTSTDNNGKVTQSQSSEKDKRTEETDKGEEMQIDFPNLDVSSSSPLPLLPEGLYRVKIKEHEKLKAKTGMEQIRWYGVVASGEHKGKTLLDHTALSEAASWRIGSFIHHAGIDIKSLPKLDTNSESFNTLLAKVDGREMYWYVIKDTYNGKENNKVQEYKKIEDVAGEEIDLNEEGLPDFLKDKV